MMGRSSEHLCKVGQKSQAGDTLLKIAPAYAGAYYALQEAVSFRLS